MDGLRAVFERATLSQRLLLFRRLARSKKSNDMTGGLGWQARYWSLDRHRVCRSSLVLRRGRYCPKSSFASLASSQHKAAPTGTAPSTLYPRRRRRRCQIGFGQSMNRCSTAKRRAR
ncbi:hypothetical protein EFK07_08725 [Pseudomonas putida]|uniref:Uncharacterized protein n=1 Tax=Pseudomonas putida TaxID=303 RepID=A0A3M8TEY7_PSEPU|nr:hypothetical protein EFK07_08725 [Pseudomonas putida]